jgi:hypothetical protein
MMPPSSLRSLPLGPARGLFVACGALAPFGSARQEAV